ncbi:MAG: hypothetical protein HWN66_21910 [Candidatus Helarchaeota archaeon]|nr:hypothetical protein [Candidatus Helarchaeota archaeon]
MSIQPWEPEITDKLKNKTPEVYDNYLLFTRKVGIPNPATTLACKAPDLAKKTTYEQEKFDFIYPSNARYINREDLELSMEELLKGVLLDVDFDFPIDKKVTPDNIVSIGWGRSTVMKKSL